MSRNARVPYHPCRVRQVPLLLALVLGALPALAGSAAAATLPVQGALRATGGGPAADGAYVFILKLYDAVDAALPVWDDVLQKVEIQNGGFALTLGTTPGKPIADALLESGKPVWLGVSVGSESELPRVLLGKVPYAYWAGVAAAGAFKYAASASVGGAATGLQCSGCVVADAIADGAVAASKVGFTYAGSASKGGPADLALKAAVAVSADSAASADELKCVGCIDLKHIAPGVAKGFLVSKGPATFTGDLTVTGALAANGGLNLAGSLLSNAALHTGDAKTAKCTPAELGRLLLDEASARIHFCDGKKFQRLAVCADTCLPAVGVACGLPIASGCGDTVGCTGTGTACPGVAQCTAKGCKLLGDDSDTPGKTCLDVRNAGSKDDGAYWIDADGAGGLAPMKVYCDMTSDGGGWTLVAYAPDQKTQNLWALDVGGGVYDGVTRTAAGSLPAVAIAKLSTEMLLARSDSDGYKGNIAGTTAASKYKIPVPTTVNFVNPNPVAGNTGTRGACSSVTVTTVVGPNATGQTRYWFVNSLGVTWTDTYPTQYGAISTTNCVNDDSGKGPSFATVFSGVKNPGQTVGDPKYWHMGWWDAVGANKSGTALIFLR